MLIQQVRVMSPQGEDRSVPVAQALARELDNYGKVTPVIYDPNSLFVKTLIDAKRIEGAPEQPTREQLQTLAKAMDARYILILQAYRDGGTVVCVGELARVGTKKPIWGPISQNFSALVGAKVDAKVAAESAARTVALQLISEPLKTESEQPKLESPGAGTGTGATTKAAPPENQPWIDGQMAFKNKDFTEATALLRSAVDRDPMNGDIRALLVRSYLNLGMIDSALDEANRALTLVPGNVPLRLSYIQALTQSGRVRDAESAYRQILVADKNNLDAIMGLADALIARLQPEEAATLLRQARALAPQDPEVAASLSEALAMAGDFESSLKERDAAMALGLSKDLASAETRYSRLVTIVNVSFNQLVSELSDLSFKLAQSKGKYDLELTGAVANTLGRSNSVAGYLEQMPRPAKFNESHARRVFAANLLSESVMAMKRAVEQSQPDALNDATVSRGEALRELAAASTLFDAERARKAPAKEEKPPKPEG